MYCEVPSFFSYSYPISRKEHRCCECLAPISKGEKYGKFTGMWCGEIQTYKQHIICEAACVYIRKNMNDDECIGFGDLFYYLSELKWCTNYKKKHIGFRKMVAEIKKRKRHFREE